MWTDRYAGRNRKRSFLLLRAMTRGARDSSGRFTPAGDGTDIASLELTLNVAQIKRTAKSPVRIGCFYVQAFMADQSIAMPWRICRAIEIPK